MIIQLTRRNVTTVEPRHNDFLRIWWNSRDNIVSISLNGDLGRINKPSPGIVLSRQVFG